MFFDRDLLNTATHLRRGVDDVFNNVMAAWPFEGRSQARRYPALNIWEDDDKLYAEAEVPGLSMEQIEVLVVGDELTIKGHRKEHDGQSQSYHRRERGTGEFSRTIVLPFPVNQDKVEATLRDGVLTLTMPKAESARPRKITVKSS